MYVQYKKCPENSSQYLTLKSNISVLNAIPKRTIREAKITYFGNLFNQYKSDIKMTWKLSHKSFVNQAANGKNFIK